MEILEEDLVAEGLFQLLLFLFSMKRCIKCLQEKSLESFSLDRQKRDGRQGSCKECTQLYRDLNREIIKKKSRENLELKRGYCKMKYTEEGEKLYQQIIQKQRRDRPEAKEKITKYQAEYNKINRESRSAKRRERLQIDPLFKLSASIRNNISGAFQRACQGIFWKQGSTIELLGCSFEDFTSYIASQFTEGMTLENYGEWHLDHIVPLATAITREDIVRLNHYTNFQPLWAKDNLSKGAKLI